MTSRLFDDLQAPEELEMRLGAERIVARPADAHYSGGPIGPWRSVAAAELPTKIRGDVANEPVRAIAASARLEAARVVLVGRWGDPIVGASDASYRTQEQTRTFDFVAFWRT
jgi:hypothetical protein